MIKLFSFSVKKKNCFFGGVIHDDDDDLNGQDHAKMWSTSSSLLLLVDLSRKTPATKFKRERKRENKKLGLARVLYNYKYI